MTLARCTASLKDPDSDALFNVSGTSDTIAEARAELNAKLGLMTNYVLLGISESAVGAIGDYPAASSSKSGTDSDATLTLRKGTDRATTRTVSMKNVDTAVKNATAQDGSIDISNALITAFGTAYRDATGTGGYTVIRGQLFP